jgi:membrane-bound lytic murein transglycosylase B
MKIKKIYPITLSILLLSACSTKSIKKDTKRVDLGIKVDSYQAIDLNRSNNIGKNVYNFQSEENINQNITQNDNIDNSDYSYLGGEFANNYLLMDFIDRMVVEHGFDKKYLNRIFSQAQYFYIIPKSKDCTSTIIKRGGAWDRYRDCFIYEDNIQRGLDFWEKYEDTLNRAEATYGVPVKYILAILGVETAYGVNFGKYRVIDVLTTKSMTGHRRSKFYTDELEKYLLITRDIGVDPTELMGSTSGALGYGQFMPSSYMRFAIDFNGDGKRDLWDAEDAIGSIANYFAENGWRANIPKVAVRAKYKGNRFNRLKTGYKTKYSLSRLKKRYHIIPREKFVPYGKVSLIKLPRATYDELWLGSPNFRVITRYNHSTFYGMTVFQLGEILEKRRYGGAERL